MGRTGTVISSPSGMGDRVHHLHSSTGSTTVDNVVVGVHSNVEFGVESLNFSGPEGSE